MTCHDKGPGVRIVARTHPCHIPYPDHAVREGYAFHTIQDLYTILYPAHAPP